MLEFPTGIERIALLGDVHGNTDYTVSAVGIAAVAGAQVIVQLGDFGYQFTSYFLDRINTKAIEENVFVMFVDGNHENFNELYSYRISDDGIRRLRERVWHLPRGFRWSWQGVKFLALGGAVSVDRTWRTPMVEWWPQEQVTVADLNRATEDGEVDVMVTHDCPDGVDIPMRDGSWIPEAELRASHFHRIAIGTVVDSVRPAHLFHGHYHVLYTGQRGNTKVVGLGGDMHNFNESLYILDVEQLRRGE